MIAVDGRLQIRQWTDNDGNKRFVTEVIADNVYFGDSRPNQNGQNSQTGYPAAGGDFGGYPAQDGSYGGYSAYGGYPPANQQGQFPPADGYGAYEGPAPGAKPDEYPGGF